MITRFNGEKLAKNLPDAYRKDDGSNNAKILEIEHGASSVLREAVRAVYDSLDINKAYGKTLDLYGEMLGQRRGMATDEQYRVLLKNKIQRNFTNSDMNGIIRAICATFDCEPTELLLMEPEPCVVSIEGLPIHKLAESNIDMNTAIAIITSLIPTGVHVEAISFAGTFEFSDGTELVYDEGKGFADEAQTIGGTLGLVADNESGLLPA